MDAEQVIEKLASRYKRVRTYQDAGILQSYSVSHASTISFKSYFQAPSLYKFQWRNEFTWNEDLPDETPVSPRERQADEHTATKHAGAAATKHAGEAATKHADRGRDNEDDGGTDDVSTLDLSTEEHGQTLEPTKFGMVWANSHGVFCKKDTDDPKRKRNLRSALTESPIMEQVAQRPMGLIFPNLVPRASRIDLIQNGVLKPRLSDHNYFRIEFEIPDGTLNVFIHAENFSLMRTITTVRAAVDALEPTTESPSNPDVHESISIDCFYTKVHFDAYINEVVFTDSP